MAGNGRITDEKVEQLRARIAIAACARPFNGEAHLDTNRHFAHGRSDDNPPYYHPDCAGTSPWQGLIAPPFHVNTLGTDVVSRYSIAADIAQLMRGDPCAAFTLSTPVTSGCSSEPYQLPTCRNVIAQRNLGLPRG